MVTYDVRNVGCVFVVVVVRGSVDRAVVILIVACRAIYCVVNYDVVVVGVVVLSGLLYYQCV